VDRGFVHPMHKTGRRSKHCLLPKTKRLAKANLKKEKILQALYGTFIRSSDVFHTCCPIATMLTSTEIRQFKMQWINYVNRVIVCSQIRTEILFAHKISQCKNFPVRLTELVEVQLMNIVIRKARQLNVSVVAWYRLSVSTSVCCAFHDRKFFFLQKNEEAKSSRIICWIRALNKGVTTAQRISSNKFYEQRWCCTSSRKRQ